MVRRHTNDDDNDSINSESESDIIAGQDPEGITGNDGLPLLPPSYDHNNEYSERETVLAMASTDRLLSDLESGNNSTTNIEFSDTDSDTSHRNIIQMEIEEPSHRTSIHDIGRRASLASHRIANEFSTKIVTPVQKFLDPISQIWSLVSQKIDGYLAKVGNPLIMRRFVYVIVISSGIYLVISSDAVNRSQMGGGGSFSGGLDDGYMTINDIYNFINENIDKGKIEEHIEYLSSMPHLAGSVGDLTLAKYIKSEFKNYGIKELELNEFQGYVDYPTTESLIEMISTNNNDKGFSINLQENEGGDNDDLDAGINKIGFNTGSFNGESTGHFIYANYGSEKDFKILKENNIIIKDSIVIIRYGNDIPTGLKIKFAQNNGAKGVILFTDDKLMGSYYTLDSIQRDGAGLITHQPGLVPNDEEDIEDAILIPSIPIAWSELFKIMSKTSNHGFKLSDDWLPHLPIPEPENNEWWSGNITNIDYKIHMKNKMKVYNEHAMWNVIGRIDGGEQDYKAIIIGAQRDSFCYGAIDPNSGTAILLELAKIFSMMRKHLHWTPRRSIYFISWDGTEYNLAGSKHFAEERKDALIEAGYLYINLDSAISGKNLEIKGHPIFQDSIKEILRNIRDPITNETFDLIQSKNYKSTIGYNNNYIPLISLAGIPTLEISFKGDSYPEKSCHDTFERIIKFGDKTFDYHQTLTQILSELIFKYSDEPIIPFNLNDYCNGLESYVDDLKNYASIQPSWDNNQRLLSTSNIIASIKAFTMAGARFDNWIKAWHEIIIANSNLEPSLVTEKRLKWNDGLAAIDKAFLIEEGLPGRSWFKNILFGPQQYPPISITDNNKNDWEWGTFPSVRDAIYQNNWELAQKELDKVADLLYQESKKLVQ